MLECFGFLCCFKVFDPVHWGLGWLSYSSASMFLRWCPCALVLWGSVGLCVSMGIGCWRAQGPRRSSNKVFLRCYQITNIITLFKSLQVVPQKLFVFCVTLVHELKAGGFARRCFWFKSFGHPSRWLIHVDTVIGSKTRVVPFVWTKTDLQK